MERRQAHAESAVEWRDAASLCFNSTWVGLARPLCFRWKQTCSAPPPALVRFHTRVLFKFQYMAPQNKKPADLRCGVYSRRQQIQNTHFFLFFDLEDHLFVHDSSVGCYLTQSISSLVWKFHLPRFTEINRVAAAILRFCKLPPPHIFILPSTSRTFMSNVHQAER